MESKMHFTMKMDSEMVDSVVQSNQKHTKN